MPPGSGQAGHRGGQGGGDAFVAVELEAEVVEPAVVQAVDDAVDGEGLAAAPGVADDGGARDVDDLFEDVEFAEAVDEGFALGRGGDEVGVAVADVFDVAEPVLDEPQVGRGSRAAATPPQP